MTFLNDTNAVLEYYVRVRLGLDASTIAKLKATGYIPTHRTITTEEIEPRAHIIGVTLGKIPKGQSK